MFSRKLLSLKSLAAGILATGMVTAGAWYWLEVWSRKPLLLSEGVEFMVPQGVSIQHLSSELYKKGLIDNQLRFEVWVRLTNSFRHFKAGKYLSTKAPTPEKLKALMTSGQTHHKLVLEWTVPEGFTEEQTMQRLAAVSGIPVQIFSDLTKNRAFTGAVLKGVSSSFEGFLYPATYRFYDSKPTPEEMLRRMVREFFKRLPSDYQQKCKQHALSLKEAVVFASLIEKETRIESEKPLVSEVIWNRLRKGIPLGIDASVIYGIKNFDGNLRRRHLRDPGNPYNSRIHRGLPPGPIGSPGISSLKSVFTPADEGYYYYVLIPDNTGRHHFSQTLKEHNVYVRKLVRAQRSRR